MGTDQEIQILKAANIIARELGIADPEWKVLPSLPGSTPVRRPDISRLKNLMPHYNPMSFEQGIKRTIQGRP